MVRGILGLGVLALLAGCVPAPNPGPVAQSAPANAVADQLKTTDPGALQTAALFEHACFPNIGDAVGLRTQAALLGQQPVPAAMAMQFLGGRPGMVYNMSSPEGKRVLVSFDNGICKVTALTTDADSIEAVILPDIIHDGGVPVRLVVSKDSRPGYKNLTVVFRYRSAYPIVSFFSFTPPDGSDAGKQIGIIGYNVNLRISQ